LRGDSAPFKKPAKISAFKKMRSKYFIHGILLTLTLLAANQALATVAYSGTKNVILQRPLQNLPGASTTLSLFDAPGQWDDITFSIYAGVTGFDQFYYFIAESGQVQFAAGIQNLPLENSINIKNFSIGETIGETLTWGGDTFTSYYDQFLMGVESYTSFEHGEFLSYGEFRSTTGYAGLRFADGENIYYGWLQVSVSNHSSSEISGTIIDWAYETTPGQAIEVGAVPEPSTYALLLLSGAASLWALRRRKR
jgi:hypothetical protein